MNAWDLMPALLLLLFSVAASIGVGIVVLVVRRAKRKGPPLIRAARSSIAASPAFERACVFRRPPCWIAVRSRNLLAVQAALGLQHAKPCSWIEALAGDEKLFLAPPVKGWVLVMGSNLPEPGDEVDVCFRFVLELSRKLGQVQFFSASRILHHHAWVKADGGKIVRAYAWAGRTVWNQGALTAAERELDLKCFGYTEAAERISFNQPEPVALNVDKVPLLAARWSLDPARIDAGFLQSESGVAGEPSHRY
ncbi:MAG TPA: hypothetical protein VG167_16105 [Verrucomicrobiae bacterium]|nr:hypothetical protein [Verrucomicrobiae bacterium]